MSGALLMAVIGLGLLVLMTQATGNRESYNQHYEWLTLINAVVACAMLLIILWGATKLLLRLNRGQFGSKLLIKLACIFALVGVIPGLLIYVVSYQFVSRSIESWFNVKVESALMAGLDLGRTALDSLSADLSGQASLAAQRLSDVPELSVDIALEKLREPMRVVDAVLWTSSGRLVASAGSPQGQIRAARPTVQQFKEARQQGRLVWLEGLDETMPGGDKGRIKVLVLLPETDASSDKERQLLQLTKDVPLTVVKNALEVQTAYRQYQERALAREGLRRMYISALTLSLFLAVLGAILLAVVWGNQLARPLLLLAHGMRQVALGDLTPKLALQGKDELGGLTRSFAEMTQQLLDARTHVQRSLAQLDTARGNLQTILDNLTTGVMVLDAKGIIQSTNPGAARILRLPMVSQQGLQLPHLPALEGFAQGVSEQFARLGLDKDANESDHWQKSFEIHSAGQGIAATAVTLLARGAVLPDGMRLLVFDDISEIVSAERIQAWGEVARRLAHEIKNPLTPIQLSAERLQKKLVGKLDVQDDAVLHKSVKTIVDQVDAMKRLVNEFRDYARLPSADLKPVQLNALISELMILYVSEHTDQVHRAPVITELDPACPPILADEQQLRQVIHNLLQNAQDACEIKGVLPHDAHVRLRTEWSPVRSRVRLTVVDTGPGFEPNILKRAFEPYVTTKPKGTGLGLAVVKKIADEHAAKIELGNVMQDGLIKGAQVSLLFVFEPASDSMQQPAH
jgi:nitrogen fixation/metabolism regulation signal transduction histidine kinase